MKISEAWRKLRERIDLDEYDARWDKMAEQGEHVHGEVDFLLGFGPTEVLDAGCGTGRVAIELAKRGFSVVGIDSDASMLSTS